MTEKFEITDIADNLKEDIENLKYEIDTIPGMEPENKMIAIKAYDLVKEAIEILYRLSEESRSYEEGSL